MLSRQEVSCYVQIRPRNGMIGSTTRRTDPATVPGGRAGLVPGDTRAALSEHDIERVLAGSRGDTQPVFEAITRAALAQCHASSACVFTYDGALVHIGAAAFSDPTGSDALRKFFPRPANRDTAATRAVSTRAVTLIPDVTTDPDYRLANEGLRAGFRQRARRAAAARPRSDRCDLGRASGAGSVRSQRSGVAHGLRGTGHGRHRACAPGAGDRRAQRDDPRADRGHAGHGSPDRPLEPSARVARTDRPDGGGRRHGADRR